MNGRPPVLLPLLLLACPLRLFAVQADAAPRGPTVADLAGAWLGTVTHDGETQVRLRTVEPGLATQREEATLSASAMLNGPNSSK